MTPLSIYNAVMFCVFIQLAGVCGLHAQQFCGVEVGPKVGALVKKVSYEYHQQVKCVERYLLDDKGFAMASNGELEVVISPDKGKNPLTIAHELLHLQLGAEGFVTNPRVSFPSPPPGLTLDRVKRFQTLIYDELQHRILFPRFQALGFPNGDSSFAQTVASAIKRNDPPKDLPEFEAVNLLRLHDARKTEELKSYRTYLREHGRASQVALGDWLVTNVEKSNPRTTQAGVDFMYEATRKAYSSSAYYSTTGPFL